MLKTFVSVRFSHFEV